MVSCSIAVATFTEALATLTVYLADTLHLGVVLMLDHDVQVASPVRGLDFVQRAHPDGMGCLGVPTQYDKVARRTEPVTSAVMADEVGRVIVRSALTACPVSS